jgi:hypothetical protein
MDTIQFGDATGVDRATMVDRVTRYALRFYRGEADEETLTRWAEEAVAHVWGSGVQVSGFVPMLALREVRERVRAARETESSTRPGDERPMVLAPDRPGATSSRPRRRVRPAPAGD